MDALWTIWWWLDRAFDLALAVMDAAIGFAGIFVGTQQGLFVTAAPLWSVGQYFAAAVAIIGLPFGVLGVFGILVCSRRVLRKFRI